MFTTFATNGLLRVAAAIVLGTSSIFAAEAPHAAAATTTVTGYASEVICDKLGSSLTITPSAAGVANGLTQTIYYRYWILNRSTGQYVKGYNPTTWGSFYYSSGYREWDAINASWSTVYVPATSGPASLFVLPHGRYSVYTEYWMGNGVWTYWYKYVPTLWDAPACTI
jgi:hypothetical protein